MNSRGEILEWHSIVVRAGRIVDVLPSEGVESRYDSSVRVELAHHVLLPGLINVCAQLDSGTVRGVDADRRRDGALLGMADMLKCGITCCGSIARAPVDDIARAAHHLGVRTFIGVRIDPEYGSAAARGGNLTRALEFRDRYRSDPRITAAFAAAAPAAISDELFARAAAVADEVEASIMMPLHTSRAEVETCLAQYGLRPLSRMHALGLLTPALIAVHMSHSDARDRDLACGAGVALCLCPTEDALQGTPAPIAAWGATGLRLGLGSGTRASANNDLWGDMKLLEILRGDNRCGHPTLEAWDALAAATRGAAAVLGLDTDIGTLQPDRSADICCLDLEFLVAQHGDDDLRADLPRLLLRHAGRHCVSDVWIAGRRLIEGGSFTSFDWPAALGRRANNSGAIDAVD